MVEGWNGDGEGVFWAVAVEQESDGAREGGYLDVYHRFCWCRQEQPHKGGWSLTQGQGR